MDEPQRCNVRQTGRQRECHVIPLHVSELAALIRSKVLEGKVVAGRGRRDSKMLLTFNFLSDYMGVNNL